MQVLLCVRTLSGVRVQVFGHRVQGFVCWWLCQEKQKGNTTDTFLSVSFIIWIAQGVDASFWFLPSSTNPVTGVRRASMWLWVMSLCSQIPPLLTENSLHRTGSGAQRSPEWRRMEGQDPPGALISLWAVTSFYALQNFRGKRETFLFFQNLQGK